MQSFIKAAKSTLKVKILDLLLRDFDNLSNMIYNTVKEKEGSWLLMNLLLLLVRLLNLHGL